MKTDSLSLGRLPLPRPRIAVTPQAPMPAFSSVGLRTRGEDTFQPRLQFGQSAEKPTTLALQENLRRWMENDDALTDDFKKRLASDKVFSAIEAMTRAGEWNEVDPAVLVAIASSNFWDEKAEGGLMKLSPEAIKAQNLSAEGVQNPEQNIEAAARHLGQLLKTHQQALGQALQDYYAGSVNDEGSVQVEDYVNYVEELSAFLNDPESGLETVAAPPEIEAFTPAFKEALKQQIEASGNFQEGAWDPLTALRALETLQEEFAVLKQEGADSEALALTAYALSASGQDGRELVTRHAQGEPLSLEENKALQSAQDFARSVLDSAHAELSVSAKRGKKPNRLLQAFLALLALGSGFAALKALPSRSAMSPGFLAGNGNVTESGRALQAGETSIIEHTVQSGESLSAIAQAYIAQGYYYSGTSWEYVALRIAEMNGLSNPNHLAVGQSLSIPVQNSTPVEPMPAPVYEAGERTWYRKDGTPLSSEFIQGVTRLAHKYGSDPNWFLGMMAWETAGTFSPSIVNPWGYAGLIQMSEGNINAAGYTRAEYLAMSDVEQLVVVEKYFDRWRAYAASELGVPVEQVQLDTPGLVYLVVAAPAKLDDVILNPNVDIYPKYSNAWNINTGWHDPLNDNRATLRRLNEIVLEKIEDYSRPSA